MVITITSKTISYINNICNTVNLLFHFIILGKEKLP